MQLKATTYEQYLHLVADASPGRLREEAHVIIERFKNPQSVGLNFGATTFLIDYTTRKYIYLDESCSGLLGNPATYYYATGLDELLRQTLPGDFTVVNEQVFPRNFSFLEALPLEKYNDIVFSHNFRIHNPNGEIVTMLQRYSYISGTDIGKPIGVVGVAFNITHFKKDLSIIHTIEETIRDGFYLSNKLLYKATYPIYEANGAGIMSKREMEVLHLISQGLNSKQIASRLNISLNTVNNHRKNMLQKTNCKTSPELLRYAVNHGIL